MTFNLTPLPFQIFFTDKNGQVTQCHPNTLKCLPEDEVTFFICVRNRKFKEQATKIFRKWEKANRKQLPAE